MRVPRELPFAPVAGILEARKDKPSAEWVGLALGAPTPMAARRLYYRTVARGLTVWEADRLATRLGLHPSLIWGEAWWTARHEADETSRLFRRVRGSLNHVVRRERCAARDRAEWVGQVNHWEARTA